MDDFTAGHISSAEARRLINDIENELGSEAFHFYPGVGYRHLMVWKGGDPDLATTPPHDITGKGIEHYLPQGPGSEKLKCLMRRSWELLADHPVNQERVARG